MALALRISVCGSQGQLFNWLQICTRIFGDSHSAQPDALSADSLRLLSRDVGVQHPGKGSFLEGEDNSSVTILQGPRVPGAAGQSLGEPPSVPALGWCGLKREKRYGARFLELAQPHIGLDLQPRPLQLSFPDSHWGGRWGWSYAGPSGISSFSHTPICVSNSPGELLSEVEARLPRVSLSSWDSLGPSYPGQ